jgi:hypothetical protein
MVVRNIVEITCVEVPCCFGLTHITKDAIVRSGLKKAFEDVTIDLHGNVSRTELVEI